MWPLLVSVIVLVAAPAVTAQGVGASAEVTPSVVPPGSDLELVFRVDSPELFEVGVSERVTCIVTDPDGVETPLCDRAGALLELRLLSPSSREYVFAYAAPDVEGEHHVRFRLDSVLTIPPTTRSADAIFVVDVSAPAMPEARAGVDGRDGTDGASGTAGADGDSGRDGSDGRVLLAAGVSGGPGRTDAERWIVSASVGAASFVALLAASRFAR